MLSINEQLASADTTSSSSNDNDVSTTTVNTQKVIESNNFMNSEIEIELNLSETVCNLSQLKGSIVDNDNSSELKQNLARWAIRYNIPHNAMTDLLKTLQEHVAEKIPLCSKTLLQTPRKLNICCIPGGKYFYFGVKTHLQKLIQYNILDNFKFPKHKLIHRHLSLSLSTDGVPICKSTNLSMWPILVMVDQARNLGPFLVALYSGETKPTSISEFLKPLIDELSDLLLTGMECGSVKYTVSISSVIADAPARSFVKCIKGHNAYHACERCEDEGEYFLNRMVYSTKTFQYRTDISFRSKRDPDHHQRTLLSPFLDLKIDMVKDFVLDYMHLVCLGVMKKLLLLWLSGPLTVRLPSRLVKNISSTLIGYASFFPREFSRKPRSLNDVNRFKATELRQFLLYTGPCSLKGILPDKLFVHFLYLHCAMKILLSDKSSDSEFNSLAKLLLEKFVRKGSEHYGNQFVVYNVHNLLHLADDGLAFGNLDYVSAFPFENFMQKLKRYIRGQHLQIEQVVCRVFEENAHFDIKIVKKQLSVVHKKGYKVIHKNFVLTTTLGNNCFIDKLGRILLLESFDDEDRLVCRVLKKENVEWYPIPSHLLSVFKVKKCTEKVVVNLNDVYDKCLLLKYNDTQFMCHQLYLK